MQTVKFGASARHFPLLLLAAGTVLALFLWQGHKGFEMWDEGYLWYGVQRVMAGEVPMRDFMAYDAGRYYWSAAFMRLVGNDSILALRGVTALFQALGLCIGLLTLSYANAKPVRLFWPCAVVTLIIWMVPWFKAYDVVSSITLVGALTFQVRKPGLRRYLIAGTVVGLVAVIGRNHGVYGVAASLGLMVCFEAGRRQGPGLAKSFLAWGAGVVIGYLPVLFMLVAIPDFALAFWQSILFLFEVKATNLPLPIPWPWLVTFAGVSAVTATRDVLIGFLFIAIVVFGVLGIASTIRQRFQDKPINPVFAAASFLALPYAHYAYSRADLVHLAQGIFPFLIGILALIATRSTRVQGTLAVLLCGASIFIALPAQPGWQCRITGCSYADVGGSRLKMEAVAVNNLSMLETLAKDFAPNNRSIIVAPFWPGAYAVLKRKAPMWEIYAFFKRSEAFERSEIERIKRADPGFALIIDFALDGRDDLRFRQSHPLIYQYIKDHFVLLKDYSPNSVYQVYKRKPAE